MLSCLCEQRALMASVLGWAVPQHCSCVGRLLYWRPGCRKLPKSVKTTFLAYAHNFRKWLEELGVQPSKVYYWEWSCLWTMSVEQGQARCEGRDGPADGGATPGRLVRAIEISLFSQGPGSRLASSFLWLTNLLVPEETFLTALTDSCRGAQRQVVGSEKNLLCLFHHHGFKGFMFCVMGYS